MAVNRGVRAGRRRILPPSDPNWSQADQRRGEIKFDQHERPYHTNIELDSGDPTGPIDPQFTAPLIPHQKYLEMVADDPRRIYINYPAWKRDIREDRARWNRDARQRSQVRYGERYDSKAPITAEIIDIIGPPPEPIEPIIAAEQGNSWVLGFTDKVDQRLAKYFDLREKREDEELDFRDEPEPDFSDTAPAPDWRLGDQVVEEEEEDLAALEESHDRGAVGGKRVDPRSQRPQPRVAQRGSGGRKGQGGKGKTTGKRSTPAKAEEVATT